MNEFNYKRRTASVVHIGNVPMGGEYPIRVQSMTSTNTNDTEASATQVMEIVDAGATYVRLTAQGVREAENLQHIKTCIRQKGYTTPLIADIHFNPRAAETAARYVEKVRINPGNFVDRVKTFSVFEYTDEEYQQEIDKIKAKLIPLLDICKQHKTALRLGVNHGSLSDRIMSRYGDTPEGMVESCMEFLRICVAQDFHEIVISMKTSNTIVMNQAVRLLIKTMDAENLHFPLHLGVTEAGDGEDGRIKSAVGIGALLSMGIGDTIRVSLSEDPQFEIPVANKIVDYITQREEHPLIEGELNKDYNPFTQGRRKTKAVENIGGDNQPVVISTRTSQDFVMDAHFLPDYIYVGNTIPAKAPRAKGVIVDIEGWEKEPNTYPLAKVNNLSLLSEAEANIKFLELDYDELNTTTLEFLANNTNVVVVLDTQHINGSGEQKAFMHTLLNAGIDTPVVLKRTYNENVLTDLQIKAAIDFGAVLLEGFGNGVMLCNTANIEQVAIDKTLFGILQASRLRTSKTEYISCPSCGRTLFDLQTTVAKVKAATSHLTHLKIGIMGCIVNGPGEMADADYGYVGAEKGKISLYKKKECVKKNIQTDRAVDELVALIKEHNDWVEPEK